MALKDLELSPETLKHLELSPETLKHLEELRSSEHRIEARRERNRLLAKDLLAKEQRIPLLVNAVAETEKAKIATVKEALNAVEVQIYDHTGKLIPRNSSKWTSARSDFNEKASHMLTVVLKDMKPDQLQGEAVGQIFKQSEGKAFIRQDKGCFNQTTSAALISGALIGIIDEIDLGTKEITFKLWPLTYKLKYEEIVDQLKYLAKQDPSVSNDVGQTEQK